MKKKVFAAVMAAAMTASLFAGCGSSTSTSTTTSTTSASTEAATEAASTEAAEVDYGSGTITIWTAEAMKDLTQAAAEQFIADKGADYTITVEAVGEDDAAKNMLTDVEGGADIFGFAQDQLGRLVSAGALQPLNQPSQEFVKENNDEGSITAVTAGDYLYAFPMTSDNGYFLYYDKSVVTDPTSLEQIEADCLAAGKSFYFDCGNAWYNASFFFATGADLTFDTDSSGKFTAVNGGYANEAGVIAMREMIELINCGSFVNGSSVDDATNIGAIVCGTWGSTSAKKVLGDNYACAELPSFVGSDGNTYHLSGFSGYKLLGIKPQTETGKLMLCYELAQYLTDTDVQLQRYAAAGWGPSNLTAQEDATVQADEALSALRSQLAYDVVQGQYPGDWWALAGALAGDIQSGNLTADSTDDQIMANLQSHDDTCQTYIGQ